MVPDVAVSWQEEPGVGRAFVIGCVLGAVVSFGGMTLAGLIGGLGLGASLGLAAFVAFWGGLGFGGMLGGVAGAVRLEAAHDAQTVARQDAAQGGGPADPPADADAPDPEPADPIAASV